MLRNWGEHWSVDRHATDCIELRASYEIRKGPDRYMSLGHRRCV